MKAINQLRRVSTRLRFLSGALMAFIIITRTAQAAQHAKSAKGPKPVGAVNSSNGSVYNKGEYGIIFKYSTFKQNQLYDGNDDVDYTRPVKGGKHGKRRSINTR